MMSSLDSNEVFFSGIFSLRNSQKHTEPCWVSKEHDDTRENCACWWHLNQMRCSEPIFSASIVRSFGTNFANPWLNSPSKLNVPIPYRSQFFGLWYDDLARPQPVLVQRNFHCLFEGLPERGSLSIVVRQSLKRLYHSFMRDVLMTVSSKGFWIMRMASAYKRYRYLLTLGEIWCNIAVQVLCHFVKTEIQRTLTTRLHSLADWQRLTLSEDGKKFLTSYEYLLYICTEESSLVYAGKYKVLYLLNILRIIRF